MYLKEILKKESLKLLEFKTNMHLIPEKNLNSAKI